MKARIDARNQLETYCYNMKQVGAYSCHFVCMVLCSAV